MQRVSLLLLLRTPYAWDRVQQQHLGLSAWMATETTAPIKIAADGTDSLAACH